MLTTIQLYYSSLKTDVAKKDFRQSVIDATGISESTFYRILQNEPGKLLKKCLSDKTGIEVKELYKTIDHLKTTKTTTN